MNKSILNRLPRKHQPFLFPKSASFFTKKQPSVGILPFHQLIEKFVSIMIAYADLILTNQDIIVSE